MEAMIETIKLAVADDATSEAKQAGAAACRAILAALETEPGVALAVAQPVAQSPLAGVDPTQLLDLVIAKLRSVVGEDAASNPTKPGYRVQIVPVPRGER